MISEERQVGSQRVPTFLYGTAWKEDATEGCVTAALRAGFRGIDTANQRKHYYEAGVGAALRRAFDIGQLSRSDVFLQTKFTFQPGQDHRLPYDPRASITEQVDQSFLSSLDHLGVEKLDSLVLHGPTRRSGLGAEDREAYRAMEALVREGRVELLGVSNVSAEQLAAFCDDAEVRPAFVQNRCYAERGWDSAVREVCAAQGVAYQGFSLLTANRRVLASPVVVQIAERHEATTAQVIFRFAMQLGMFPLTGTTNPQHMIEDLGAYRIELSDEEVNTILTIES